MTRTFARPILLGLLLGLLCLVGVVFIGEFETLGQRCAAQGCRGEQDDQGVTHKA